ncbi:MAG TPA: hypothetical protein VKD72_19935 [Gemmataceae bacterium]|nr:hypothetical protein [Gemmataceae bacterium]
MPSSRHDNRLPLPAILAAAALLLLAAATAFYLLRDRPGADSGDDPPPGGAPSAQPESYEERVAQLRRDLDELAAGRIDARALSITLSYDGKDRTADGRGAGSLFGSGPGIWQRDQRFSLTREQKAELIAALQAFPWLEVSQAGVGDITTPNAAHMGITIRLREWSRNTMLYVNAPGPSLFQAKGDPKVEKVARLGALLHRLMTEAPRVAAPAVTDLSDALAKVASGEVPGELLSISCSYAWKIKAKADGLLPDRNRPGPEDSKEVAPEDRAERWSVVTQGPLTWALRDQNHPVLVLSSEEIRELAGFLKEIGADRLHEGLEKVPHDNPLFVTYRRPGHRPERPWKTRLDFRIVILGRSLGVEIMDVEELPAAKRRPYERLLERFEKLHRRLLREGRPMTYI